MSALDYKTNLLSKQPSPEEIMVKRKKSKALTTHVTPEHYERLQEIIEEENLGTVSMLVRTAITQYCERQGYADIDLTANVKSWGGKREGSGRPPHNEQDD